MFVAPRRVVEARHGWRWEIQLLLRAPNQLTASPIPPCFPGKGELGVECCSFVGALIEMTVEKHLFVRGGPDDAAQSFTSNTEELHSRSTRCVFSPSGSGPSPQSMTRKVCSLFTLTVAGGGAGIEVSSDGQRVAVTRKRKGGAKVVTRPGVRRLHIGLLGPGGTAAGKDIDRAGIIRAAADCRCRRRRRRGLATGLLAVNV